MGTKVLKLENRKHGSYQFETTHAKGKEVFKANGTIHDISPDRKIIRTLEMENASFDVQLEVLEFEKLTDETSRLKIHTIYESVAQLDNLL